MVDSLYQRDKDWRLGESLLRVRVPLCFPLAVFYSDEGNGKKPSIPVRHLIHGQE